MDINRTSIFIFHMKYKGNTGQAGRQEPCDLIFEGPKEQTVNQGTFQIEHEDMKLENVFVVRSISNIVDSQ